MRSKHLSSFGFIRIFTLVIALSGRLTSSSQVIYEYGLSSGIPSIHLYDIETNDSNLIWVSSDNGLFAFDGYHFHPTKLNNNDVLEIHYDMYNRMWGINASGNIFFVENGVVHNSENTEWLPKELSSITCKLLNYKRDLYLAHRGYIDIIHYNSYERYQIPFASSQIKQLWEYRDDVYIRDAESFYRVTEGNIQKIESDILPGTTFDITTRGDTILLLGANEIRRGYIENDTLKSETLISHDQYIGGSGTQFFTDHNKVYAYSKNIVYQINFETYKLDVFYNAKCQVTRLKEDHFGNIWLATFDRGLLQIPASMHGIKQVMNFDPSGARVCDFVYGSNMVTGTIDGHISYKNRTHRFSEAPRVEIRELKVSDADIYAGTDGGLIFIDGATGRMKVNHLMSIKAFQMLDDSLLIGNNTGLFKIGLANIQKAGDNSEGRNIHPRRVYTFLNDESDNLWVSSINGFYLYKNGRRKLVFEDVSSIQSACLKVLQFAPKHILLLTADNEIYISHETDLNATKIYSFPRNIRVNRIMVHDGSIWSATNHGLLQLVPHTDNRDSFITGKAVVFDSKLYDSDITRMQIEGDSIFFINSHGLFLAEISKIDQPHMAFPSMYNASCAEGPLRNGHEFNLTRYGSKNLTLEWFDPCYCRPDFFYRIVGTDEDWLSMSENTLHLPDLQLGKTKIEIAMSDGISDPGNVTSVTLNVRGRLMEYPWFKVSLIAFIVLLLLGIYFIWTQIRNRAKSLRQELLLTEASLKLTSLQSQMNPHFMRNSLNSIQSLIHQNQKENASKFISSFSQLIEEFIRLSGQNFITLEHELEIINNFVDLEQLRFVNEFEYILEVDENVPLHLEVPTMFLQPVVENAIEHGLMPSTNPSKILKLKVQYSNNTVEISVIDNGVGVWRKIEGSDSIALSNIRNRINTMNAFDDLTLKMDIFDHAAGGFEFEFGTTVHFTFSYHE